MGNNVSDLMVVLPPGVLSGHAQLADSELTWFQSDREGRGDLAALGSAAEGLSCCLVLSGADALVSSVQLARKQARHIRKVVPFLLEDQLTMPAESQWFAWGERVDDVYPVVAADREGLEQLLQAFSSHNVHVDSIKVDVQLLADQAPARLSLGDHDLLLLAQDQLLSVPAAMTDAALKALSEEETTLSTPEESAGALLWKACQSGNGVELLHSELAPRRQKKTDASPRIPERWQRPALVSAVLFGLVWVIMAAQAWFYQNQADQAREQAVALYEQLFPGDRARRLEAQFRSRLQAGGGGSGEGFLSLLASTGEAIAPLRANGVQPRRIQYDERQNALELELNAPDYETLEQLQSGLREKGLQAEIANFRNQGEVVTARMKVTS